MVVQPWAREDGTAWAVSRMAGRINRLIMAAKVRE